MKRNRLYTVNKYNKHGFMFQGLDDKPENLYGFGSAFMKASGLGNLKSMFSAEGIGNSLGQFIGDMFGTSTYKGVSANPETEDTTDNGGVNTTPQTTEEQMAQKAAATATVGQTPQILEAFGRPVYRTPKGNLHFLGGITGGLASAVGGAVGGLLSNGNTSTVGSVVDKVGDVVGAIPGFGTIAGAGLKVLSGGINALFGSKVDQAKLQAANRGTNAYNSFTSKANTFDEIKMAQAQEGVQDAYSGGLFVKGDAAEKNKRLHDQRIAARQFASNAVANNISNLAADQLNNAAANFSAFGGPLGFGTSALGLMQQDKYFDTIDNRSDAIASKKEDSVEVATTPSQNKGIFASGGTLESSFIDEFGSDPIAAAIRYSKGIERREAEKQAAAEQAAREAEYTALQNQLSQLQTQNMGLQSIIDAMPSYNTPEAPETTEYSSPSVATPRVSSGNTTWDYIEDQLRRSGRFNDTQIQGIKYNLQRESSIDPTVVGDNGAAFGLGQWHGSRKPKDMSLEGQTRHLIDTISNFDGKDHWIRRSDYEGFLNARTPEEAHYYLAKGYERPRADIVAKVKRDSDMSLKNIHAFGGELGTNGTDFTNGLLYIDEGDTHERNPLDGVPMGVDAEGIPNLVEEGETVYNNYVFSDRMKVPGFMYKELGLGGVVKKKSNKGMSFADASKKLARESEQRPNDPISMAGLDASLAKLAEVQETERARKNMEEYVGLGYACGGKIHKYGLGGNMYDFGGALRWLQEHHPEMGNKNEVAKIINKRAKAIGYRGTNTNDKVYDYEGTLKSMMASNKPLGEDNEKLFESLVSDGMDRKVAFGLAYPMELSYPYGGDNYGKSHRTAREAAYKKYITDYKATKKPQKQEASATNVTPSEQQTVAAGSNKGYSQASLARQAASPQQTAAASVSAEKPKGSSRGGSKGSGSKTVVGTPSDFEFGKKVEKAAAQAAAQSTPQNDFYWDDEEFVPVEEETPQEDTLELNFGDPEERARADSYGFYDGQYGLNNEQKGKPYSTWMRYAPVVGSGLAVLTDTLGLTNKADYSNVAGLEAAANAAGYTPNVTYDPIGNYLRYNPMDIWYQQNALNAQARATDRALLNSSSPSRAAGLLASGYNSQLASGNLYRQALEYNDAQRKEVEDFNRKTNMFNSQMGLEAAMANARYRQQGLSAQMSGLAQAAAMKDTIDARASAARSANLTNFFDSLGDIGRENFAYNMVNSTAAANNGYGFRSRDGWVAHNTAFGGKIKKRKR